MDLQNKSIEYLSLLHQKYNKFTQMKIYTLEYFKWDALGASL